MENFPLMPLFAGINMKKYLVIILFVLAGIYIYIHIQKTERQSDPSGASAPEVSISIKENDSRELEFSDLEKIIELFAKLGYTNVAINDFRWEKIIDHGQIPHYKKQKVLNLTQQDVVSDLPTPQEKYDFGALHNWCKHNAGKYAELSFGAGVKFDILQETSQIFIKYDIPCLLQRSFKDRRNTDIKIELYQAPEEKAKQPACDESISDSEALDIAEATFRYQLDRYASDTTVCFLTILGNAPDPVFIKRFQRTGREIRKGSKFKVGTGRKFNISRMKRISKTKIEVWGGYYQGPLNAAGDIYVVELKDGAWVVTGEKRRWVS